VIVVTTRDTDTSEDAGLGRQSLERRIRQDLPHLDETEARALAEIVARLVDAYDPERVYLFGSKARGDQGPDSDFDLLLIVPEAAPMALRDSQLAYKVLRGTGTAADVLVLTRTAFDSRLHLAASLPATVAREGRLLHAA
jgi:predicted nucleotidyltransferase